MKILKTIAVLSLFLMSAVAVAAPHATIDSQQKTLLAKAWRYGKLIGYPETIQAILLQETSAGTGSVIGDDGKSLGIMQMKPETAMYVTTKYTWLPQLKTRAAFAARLLKSKDYALLLGTLYFKECLKVHKSWSRAVVCYNAGITGAKVANMETHVYLKAIKKKINFIRKHKLNESKASKESTSHNTNPVPRYTGSSIQALYSGTSFGTSTLS